MEPVIVGISIGDLNGVGPEVALKCFSDPRILNICTPVIFGSVSAIEYYQKLLDLALPPIVAFQNWEDLDPDCINVFEAWEVKEEIVPGELNADGGKYALASLEAAVAALKAENIDALVTAPINKKAMSLAGFKEVGHTEYLGTAFGIKDPLMLLVADELRVALVTGHNPVSKIAELITKELILSKLKTLKSTLEIDFGIDQPRIAVLGLNPHAGDDGLIGKEENTIIKPAIAEAKTQGILAFGPFGADGLFGSGQWKKFDAVLAMFHDQGLGPFKAISFGEGVNYTCGLPAIRTSPDHGTGFDIAGQNIADERSFRKAVFLAVEAFRARETYNSARENPIKRALRSKSKAMREGRDEVLFDRGDRY